MARRMASAKWAEGSALDGWCDMPLALRLSERLNIADIEGDLLAAKPDELYVIFGT